jgi:zinc protease
VIRRCATVVAVSVAASLSLAAQQAPQQNPSTAPGTVLKNRAPVSSEILKVHLPKPQEADLPNGIHLMVLEDHRAPLVNMQLIVEGAGGYYDPSSSPGLAGFTAALMREGTTNKTSEQISEDLDRLAATLTVNAGTSSPFATVFASCLNDQVDTLLGMMADVVQHPSFPEAEIGRYKNRTRALLTNQRAQPGFLALERFSAAAYGDHPASRVAASPAALDALTREQLVAFHHDHYVPDHAVLAIAGDITMAAARQKIEAALGAWAKSSTALDAVKEPAAVAGPSISLVARPNSVQTNLVVGTQSVDRTSPDYVALTVANRILGGGPTARLFEHLREQKGYTYGAYSNFSAGRYRGPWSASTEVRTDVTEPALTDLLADIKQMREVPVPAKELADSQRALVASFARSLESPTAVLGNYVDLYLYKLPADYWDTYPDRINAVTPADVQRVAQKYWAPDRLQIVAVGDAGKIAPGLAKLGDVRKFDAEGKAIGGGAQ